VYEQVLDSSYTDSLENRKRYWLVGISEGIAPESLALAPVQPSNRLLSSILHPVPEQEWKDHTYLKDKAISDAAAGKGFAKRQLLNGSETRIGTIGRFYAKRRSTEPFMTREDGKERLLTPLEHAAVKSVPAHLIAGNSATTAHEILGQSVDYLQPYKIMQLIYSSII
jgi:DNA (cytosine-5)-methyltransferase 1